MWIDDFIKRPITAAFMFDETIYRYDDRYFHFYYCIFVRIHQNYWRQGKADHAVKTQLKDTQTTKYVSVETLSTLNGKWKRMLEEE